VYTDDNQPRPQADIEMRSGPLAITLPLLVLCLTAAISDFRSRRIPNWLVLCGIAAGLAINTFLYGFGSPGLLSSVEGVGLALLIYGPLYAIRAMGAGDAKLMMAVGALVGPADWLRIFLITAILGGVIALVLMALRGRLRKSVWNVLFMTSELVRFRAPYMSREELDVKSGKGASLPHAITIFLGVVVFVLTRALGVRLLS
jgi:prepilin peptidase CpaA